MVTIAIAEICANEPAPRFVVKVPGVVWAFLRRRAKRRVYGRLARLPDHLIRDIGFDPEAIHDAAANPWLEYFPGVWRR